MKYKKIILAMLLLAAVASLVPMVAEAVSLKTSILNNMAGVHSKSGLPSEDSPAAVVAVVIQGLLGIVAVIFFVLVVIAGIKWMMAGGNEETVSKSKQTILNGALGLIVIIFSYAITSIVFNIILNRD
ncbi:hypothetical protein GYA13_04355 [Candidatus Kuenenbacteria bacterium]|nr:hypothetical protein [Candidatus Kuenenbacteria bacterium]